MPCSTKPRLDFISTLPEFYAIRLSKTQFEGVCSKLTHDVGTWRGGRPTTTISSPSHILLIFSSEPHGNHRPSNIFF